MIHGVLRDGRRRAANARSTRFSFICSRPTAWPCRAFATALPQGPAPINSASLNNASNAKANNQRPAPKRASKSLTAQQRLELCLPPHLRSNADGALQDETPFDPNALETAKLALESFSEGKGFLTYLAIDQGRWRAAVWLVKLLVEHFHSPPARSTRSLQMFQEWNRTGTLDDITEHPIYLDPREDEACFSPHIKTSLSVNLDEITDGSPDTLSGPEVLRHRILGLIWRDIGRLILVCSSSHEIAGGLVKPDVLEMIALLHHHELMPDSIYTYNPPSSDDAIYQPPTLPLLSHRIFEALSDATWRAREMSALEEAKKKVGGPVSLEAKGSSIRARIPGVKPEVWLELILWSCLHGGWISDGAALLHSLYRSRAQEKWTPISWRDSLNAVVPSGQEEPSNWDSISSMFDTRSGSTIRDVDVTGLRVHKTVSSEVVNAYIDALLTTVKLGVGNRGTDLDTVLRQLRSLRRLLQRANLNLGGGSWDAMMLRLIESGGLDLDENPAIVQHLVELSPPIGEELRSRRSQAVPSYVLDGSAAVLGLLHRALHTEIKNANLEGALKVFQFLQERVDNDRHQSMSDFFANKHLASEETENQFKGLFTSNFAGIEYPSFSMQIPPTILAAFLDLVTENKSYALGNWMLGIDKIDIDGPLIPLSLYSDPNISAAVVHFAAATSNSALLSKITETGSIQPQRAERSEPTLPEEFLRAFVDAQVDARRWDAAERLLEYMRDAEIDWSVNNVAVMAKAMIIESQSSSKEQPNSDYHRAETMFTSLVTGKYGTPQPSSEQNTLFRTFAQNRFLDSLCVMVSSVSPELAATMHRHSILPKKVDFQTRAIAFNNILEAILATQNSKAGRAFVDKFTREKPPVEFRPKRPRSEDEEQTEGNEEPDDALSEYNKPATSSQRMSKTSRDEEQIEENEDPDDDLSEYDKPATSRQRMLRILQDEEQTEEDEDSDDALSEYGKPATSRQRMPRTLEDAFASNAPLRSTVVVEIAGDFSTYMRNTIMYGGFDHKGPSAVLLVVRKALAERAEQGENAPSDAKALEIFAWALIVLRRAGFARSTVLRELYDVENGLTDEEMDIVEQLATEKWKAITDNWFVREAEEPIYVRRGPYSK